MKPFPLLLVVFISMFVARLDAANISWGSELFEYNYTTAEGADVYSLHAPYLRIYGNNAGLQTTIWAEASSYPEFASCFVSANLGDNVSSPYFESRTEYFYQADFDWTGEGSARADYSLDIANDQCVYLAFETMTYTSPQNRAYGWIELSVGDDGFLQLNNIVAGDGRNALIVGAVPEPSAGLLLLVGLAGLGLRRRRKVENEK